MRLLYATSILYPSTRANRIQTLMMAREFSKLLKKNFIFGARKLDGVELSESEIVLLPYAKSFVLGFFYARLIKRESVTHLFCREERLAFFILLFNKLLFRQTLDVTFEAHFIPKHDFFYWRVLKWSNRVIVLTSHTKEMLSESGVEHILVLPDGVDLSAFTKKHTKQECRRTVGLPDIAHVVLYSGQLFDWKGASVLADTAEHLPNGTLVVFVGGTEEDADTFRERYADNENVRVMGYQPHEDIPLWLKSADVLALPNSGKTDISRFHTSPMKLFEYMASGVPIVASDLPSIRDILNESNAELVEPDNPEALAAGIMHILEDSSQIHDRAVRAESDVRSYTWDRRAAAALSFIKKYGS